MSFLVIARERYALSIGETPLGGGGEDAFIAPEFAQVPCSAVITVMPDGTASIARVAGSVLVNGAVAGDTPISLRHGMRLDVAGVSMLYGDRAAHGTTAHAAGVSDDDLALLAALSPAEPTAPTGGRLIAADDDAVHAISESGLEIGRDPACGLALTSRDVSRVHARIAPGLFGYVLTDLSANGTRVNGARVLDPRLLGNGDVVRIGDAEFRFFADVATYAEPPVAPTPPGGAVATAPPRAGAPAPTLFATLEVINTGVLHGSRFRVERPLAHVGRGAHNDVLLQDDSVSGAHATLTRRASGWVVLDLGSTNGTYVDGARVVGERRLENGCELRFGNVKVVFRAMRGADRDEPSTRALVGVPDTGLLPGRSRGRPA